MGNGPPRLRQTLRERRRRRLAPHEQTLEKLRQQTRLHSRRLRLRVSRNFFFTFYARSSYLDFAAYELVDVSRKTRTHRGVSDSKKNKPEKQRVRRVGHPKSRSTCRECLLIRLLTEGVAT